LSADANESATRPRPSVRPPIPFQSDPPAAFHPLSNHLIDNPIACQSLPIHSDTTRYIVIYARRVLHGSHLLPAPAAMLGEAPRPIRPSFLARCTPHRIPPASAPTIDLFLAPQYTTHNFLWYRVAYISLLIPWHGARTRWASLSFALSLPHITLRIFPSPPSLHLQSHIFFPPNRRHPSPIPLIRIISVSSSLFLFAARGCGWT